MEGTEDNSTQRELHELRSKLYETQQALDKTESSLQLARKKITAQGAELQTMRAQLGGAWAGLPPPAMTPHSGIASGRSSVAMGGPPPGALVMPTPSRSFVGGGGGPASGNASLRSMSSARK